jgi:DNA-binding NarL/FixJ family response regulator
MERPQIVVAEDNPEMRKRVEALLGSEFDIVGSVADGQQAIDSSLCLNPDILVTDISMPIFNGLQVASRLRDAGCCAKVIFLTVHDDDDYRKAAFQTGAFGYVLKLASIPI